jgi:hypothetical protein
LYRGGLKSSNKGYRGPNRDRIAQSNARVELADNALEEIRSEASASLEKHVEYRTGLIDEIHAANCGELALAVVGFAEPKALAVRIWKIGNPEETDAIGHSLVLLARSDEDLDAVVPPFDPNGSVATKVVVVDAWTNLCTPLSDYAELAVAKMQKWDGEKKGIWSKREQAFVRPIDEEWIETLRSFASAPVTITTPIPLEILKASLETEQREASVKVPTVNLERDER